MCSWQSVHVVGSGEGVNGPPQASGPVAAGHVAGDDGHTYPGSAHQGVSVFFRQVEETSQMLKEKFEEEADEDAQKVRWSLILFN